MASRILRNAEDVDGFVRLLCAVKLPVTVTWVQGADRSHEQNALMWIWAGEVAAQLGDREAADVQAEWKLTIGIPILRADDPGFELRIAAPIGFGSLLAQALAPLRGHPKLSLQLLLDDALVDLIEARVDIALRAGSLPDSSLVARRLGSMGTQMCAAPAYLAERGWPGTPQDLAQHDWLGARPFGTATQSLVLHSDAGETAMVQVNSRAQASQVTALHALCVEGWGIGVVVSEDDRRALADGRLVPVLPGWRSAVTASTSAARLSSPLEPTQASTAPLALSSTTAAPSST